MDRVERLGNLLELLLATSQPLTAREIARRIDCNARSGVRRWYPDPDDPSQAEAFRQAFERDKRILRDAGVPLEAVKVDNESQVAYRIDASSYYLPDLDLTREERVALNLALASLVFQSAKDDTARSAVDKLNLSLSHTMAPLEPFIVVPSTSGSVAVLYEAISEARLVSFDYKGTRRLVRPRRLALQWGHWYVLGEEFSARKSRAGESRDPEPPSSGQPLKWFRVDRIQGRCALEDLAGGLSSVPAGTGQNDEGANGSAADREPTFVPDAPWSFGEGEVISVTVKLDAILAGRFTERLRADQGQGSPDKAPGSNVGFEVLAAEEDGLVVRLEVTSIEGLRSWVMESLGRVVVLEPDPIRAEIVSWLEAIASPQQSFPRAAEQSGSKSHSSVADAEDARGLVSSSSFDTTGMRGSSKASAHLSGPSRDSGSGQASQEGLGGLESTSRQDAGRSRVTPMGALARFRRLLAILGYLAECGSVSVKELALRFSMSEREAIAEIELLACIGVPPYSPDCLVEVFVDEGVVHAKLPKELARPRRLTAEEALAVLVAAKGLRDSYSESYEGAMSRVVSKLETALGVEGRVDIAVGTPPFLSLVKSSSESGQALEISYYSASKDEVTRRVIWPSEPFFFEGAWYTRAWCERDHDWRSFRVDRVLSAVKVPGRRRPKGGSPGPPGSAAVHPQDAHLQGGPVPVARAPHGEFRGTEPFPGLREETTAVLMWVRNDRMEWVVDRLAGVEIMNDEFPVQGSGYPSAWARPGGQAAEPGERPAEPGGRWQRGFSQGDGTLIRCRIGGQATLERILLALGPDAQVVAPDDWKGLAAQAATRMLDAYR